MFDLTGMSALVTGASGGLGSAIAKALAKQGARLAVSGSNVDKLEAFRAELGSDHVALPCNLADGAAVDQLVPQAVEALGEARHPCQQCGRHSRQSSDADEGRGVRGRHPDQSGSRVPADARGLQADDEGAIWAHHLDHLGGRSYRQSGPGELRRFQSRAHRHDQVGRAGAGEPRDHRQRSRTRLHDFSDDRRAQRTAAPGHTVAHSDGCRWAAATTSARPASTSRRREAGYVTGQTLHVNGGMAMF